MTDQTSRGGQKASHEREPEGKKDRDGRVDTDETRTGRDLKEDAHRGQQTYNGGYANPDRE
jgi:hypothetical protein